MKRKWMGIRVAFSVLAAFGWWGMLYPELTMTPDTYEVVLEDGSVQAGENVVEWDADGNIYEMVLKADGSRIRFKSKLLTRLDDYGKKIE